MNFLAPLTWLGKTALTGLQATGSTIGKGVITRHAQSF
jgi:hypothetical protein